MKLYKRPYKHDTLYSSWWIRSSSSINRYLTGSVYWTGIIQDKDSSYNLGITIICKI